MSSTHMPASMRPGCGPPGPRSSPRPSSPPRASGRRRHRRRPRARSRRRRGSTAAPAPPDPSRRRPRTGYAGSVRRTRRRRFPGRSGSGRASPSARRSVVADRRVWSLASSASAGRRSRSGSGPVASSLRGRPVPRRRGGSTEGHSAADVVCGVVPLQPATVRRSMTSAAAEANPPRRPSPFPNACHAVHLLPWTMSPVPDVRARPPSMRQCKR